MFAFQATQKATTIIPNILPCRISHNGPVDASKRYWDPMVDGADSTRSSSDPTTSREAPNQTVYFRGRKLTGRVVDVPKGYRGVIVQKTDKVLPAPHEAATVNANIPSKVSEEDDQDEERDEDEPLQEVKVMDEIGDFKKIMVWGHESLPVETEDPYLRGLQEWMNFSSAVSRKCAMRTRQHTDRFTDTFVRYRVQHARRSELK